MRLIRHFRRKPGITAGLAAATILLAVGTGVSLAAGGLPGNVAPNGTVTPPQIQLNTPSAAAAALKLIPAKLRSQYVGYWLYATLLPSTYTNYMPPKPPWKFCLAETYLKNAFRQGTLHKFEDVVAALKKQGLAKSDLVVTNANGNISLNAAQINQLVGQGCNVIWNIPSGPSGICSAVKNAHDHNVIFMTFTSPVVCPDALNVDFNESEADLTATYLVHALHGKGNVLIVNGIPGLKISSARAAFAKAVFALAPGIKVVGEVEGDYTASVAKAAVLKFLATHPGKIDGVWEAGAMAAAAGQAFDQAGRPRPALVDIAGECSFLAYWKDHKLNSFSIAQSPRATVQEGADITLRMLRGGKPKVNLFLYPLTQITDSNLNSFLKPGVTENSTCFAESPGDRAVPTSYWDPLFTK